MTPPGGLVGLGLRSAVVLVALTSALLGPALLAEDDPAVAAGVLRLEEHHHRALVDGQGWYYRVVAADKCGN